MSMDCRVDRQGGVRSHSRSYGDERQRRISTRKASAIEDLESAIGISCFKQTLAL